MSLSDVRLEQLRTSENKFLIHRGKGVAVAKAGAKGETMAGTFKVKQDS
jgi:hypothetical protein